MDKEKLIACVKQYSFLYDLSDKRYRDIEKKDAAWKEIATKIKAPKKDCKKAWGLLRDSFRRAIKNQKEMNFEQASWKKWKYEDEMAFLVPYLKERTALFSMTSQHDHYGVNLEGTIPSVNVLCEVSMDYEESIPSMDHPADQISPDNKEIKSPPLLNQSKGRSLSKENLPIEIEENPSTDSLLYNNTNIDDVEQFFAGIAATVKSFPKRERAIAKAKVFDVISKIEIGLVTNNPSTSYDN